MQSDEQPLMPGQLLTDYACPNCGYDGPHSLFAINEAECGDCYAEFSISPNGWNTDDVAE